MVSNVFKAFLEIFCWETNTCLTPHGELGFSLPDMLALSHLPARGFPYEEFFPTNEELEVIRQSNPTFYHVMAELFLYFQIIPYLYDQDNRVGVKHWMLHFFGVHETNKGKRGEVKVQFRYPSTEGTFLWLPSTSYHLSPLLAKLWITSLSNSLSS